MNKNNNFPLESQPSSPSSEVLQGAFSLLDTNSNNPIVVTKNATSLEIGEYWEGLELKAYEQKLKNCCKSYIVYENPESSERVAIPLGCNDRFCVTCARKRARRARLLLQAYIKEYDLHLKKHALKFITLTCENFPKDKLQWGLECFNKWITRLKQRKIWKQKVTGHFQGFEVTKDKSGAFHLHLHIIAEAEFIDVFELSKHWESIVSKEWRGFIVDIREIRNINKALKEITKYCFKPASLDIQDKCFLSKLLKGRRLYAFGGEWYQVLKGYTADDFLESDPVFEEIKKNWVYVGVFKKESLYLDTWIYDDYLNVYRKGNRGSFDRH